METKERHIQLLPTELANQIAAGEVVERPSSVLKELVENSLDASANSISAIIEDGGQASIKVSDNGRGISKEELKLAVTRHATSKVSTISDLSSINSFGFRGEALPSIASVSNFRISSLWEKDPEQQAYALDVAFGEHQEIQPVSLHKGTQVEVRNLFNNIPARLKFLKSPNTELKRAQEIFTRIALIHQNTAFAFFAGTREVLSFLVQDSLYSRLCKVWSPAITADMLEVDSSLYGMKITGFISNPRSLYSKADKLLLYVNNRPVTDKMLIRAIRQAYQSSLTSKDYPQVILNIEIDPEEVDVNVHPAKSEVRFRDEQSIFKAVYVALEKNLAKKLFVEQVGMNTQSDYSTYMPIQEHATVFMQGMRNTEEHRYADRVEPSFTEQKIYTQSTESVPSKPNGFWGYADSIAVGIEQKTTQVREIREEKKEYTEQISENALALPDFLAQIASSYLLFQQKSGIAFILDQHAVHERVLFERLAKKENLLTQKLLLPLSFSLHTSEVDVFMNLHEDFQRLGFQCEYNKDSQELVFSGIPLDFAHGNIEQFMRKALKNDCIDVNKLFMDLACDEALKANQRISHAEAMDLYKQWIACDEPDFCPHGRPCYIVLDRAYLDKIFKRI